ncbi:MAG: ATP-binding cassette domain-containing protein, partial [Gemmatimonadota bacterium]|nr:ATP-binding cassette domain-containing protein [Gemmatimonadota bacterium]
MESVTLIEIAALSVAPGTIATVIGANGAGKTTLLAALMGLLPSKGAITFEGADLTRTTAEERVGLGISLVPEQRDLFSAMTVSENLELGAFRRGRSEIPERLDDVYQLFPRLKERHRQ